MHVLDFLSEPPNTIYIPERNKQNKLWRIIIFNIYYGDDSHFSGIYIRLSL